MDTSIRFLYKSPEKWFPESDQLHTPLLLFCINSKGGEVSRLGEEGKRSLRVRDQSRYTIGENAFSLWLWKSLFKGIPSPPTRVWHVVCATDGCTVIQLLSIWHPCSAVLPASWPAAAWACGTSWFLPAVLPEKVEKCSPVFLLSQFSLS